MSFPSLLDPGFVRELESLRRHLRVRTPSGGTGGQASRRHGSSAEFEDHRPYSPGDDPRRIDWMAFARTDEPVVKLFRAEEDTIVRLLLDCSGSLAYGNPPKIDMARRLAAGLGYVALADSQRAQIVVARNQGRAEGPRPSLEWISSRRRGRAGIPALLRDLSATDLPRGELDLVRAIDQTVRVAQRPGLLVVFSDFFDPGPVRDALTRARTRGHDVALVQVLDKTEIEPPYEGDYTLEDMETGRNLELVMDDASVAAYQARLAELTDRLQVWARRHGASYTRVVTDEPIEPAIRRLIARTID